MLAVLVDLVFHHGHGGPRPQRDALANALPIATLVWSGALWAFSPTGTGGLAAFDGWFPNVFAVVLVFVACGGLVMGLRHMTAGPKWVVLYAGFGAAWYVACAAAATAGNASGGLAAAAGLTLLPPAILWRYLLALVPELPTSGSGAPTLVPEKLRASLPPFPDLPDVAPVATTPASQIGRPSSAIPFPSVPEVRASVEAAVQTAVAAQGGLAASSLSFFEPWYRGGDTLWDGFRLEGPSLTWHFRGDPHVHVWAHVAETPDVPFNSIAIEG